MNFTTVPPGRGALVISITVPPRSRKRVSASQADGVATTPLCTTPQTSLSTASYWSARVEKFSMKDGVAAKGRELSMMEGLH